MPALTWRGPEVETISRKLPTEEAAKALGVSTSWLTKLRLTGDGPQYIKIGRRVVYDPADLEAWAAARKRLSTSA